MRIGRLGWALLCALAGGTAVATPPSAFAGLPDISGVRLSPDGTRVLMLRQVGGVLQPFVGRLDTGESRRPVAIGNGRQLLRSCDWATNERVVCSFFKFYKPPRYRGGKLLQEAKSKHGYPAQGRRLVRLVAFDDDGGNLLELVPPPAEPIRYATNDDFTEFMQDKVIKQTFEWEHRVVNYLPHDPEHILVTLPREVLFVFDVYRLDIHDNAMTRVTPLVPMISAFWSADDLGRVRIGIGNSRRPWGERQFVVEDGRGGFRFQDAPHLGTIWFPPRVIGYAQDGESAYVEAHDAESGRVVAWQVDVATLAIQRLVVAYPEHDAALTPIKGTRCGIVGFADETLGALTWLDADFGAEVAALDARLPGRIRAVPSLSADCSRMVLLADGACYVHDRRSGETRRIGIRRPALDGMRGDARAVSYVARDQYRIDAWLTLPREAGAGRLPLVVMAGDQPYGAGGGYDAWAEFLASRGYAVLRPGVRGTIGRGDAHWKGGFAMWGQRMRDDLADAAAWAVASGLAAADRICYVGRGRGGYIALIGALGDESNARCAAAFAFDIPRNTLFDYRIARHHWLWNTWLGNPARFWTDTVDPFSGERLHGEIAARSPLRTPKHGGFPVLIDSGDRRRPATFHKDSGGFRRAVQAAGRLERAFPRGSQREIDFLAALATFLDGNIGDSETRPSEASSTRRSSLPGPATRPPES